MNHYKINSLGFLVCLLILINIPTMCSAQSSTESGSPRKMVKKVYEFSRLLLENNKTSLQLINNAQADSPFVWKDGYLFVYMCEKKIIVAHPNSSVINTPYLWNLRDPKLNPIMPKLCRISNSEIGTWYEYWWYKEDHDETKPESAKSNKKSIARKIVFIIRVKDTPYQVGASFYNESYAIEELNKNTSQWIEENNR